MSDNLLTSSPLVSGISVLLSFFVGYKYALKCHAPEIEKLEATKRKVAKSTGDVRLINVFV